jgi:hypothetical protein
LCPAATRAGTGVRNQGINFYGDIIVQNFRLINVYNLSYMVADKIWSDFPPACQATYPASIGVEDDSRLRTGELNLNGTGVGLVSKTGFTTADHLFLNSIGGDCVKLGDNANLNVRMIETNLGTASCGRGGSGYAVNYAPGTNTTLSILSGYIGDTATTPYINIPNTAPAQTVNIGDKILTPLANPSTLYGATTVTNCAGVGTGTCVLATSNRTTPWRGTVLLNAVGATAAFGTFRLNFPLSAANAGNCLISFVNGSAAWVGTAGLSAAGIGGSPMVQQIAWANGGVALTSGSSYGINFVCEPQ